MIEAVAASHVIGVLLPERVERRTIGMGEFNMGEFNRKDCGAKGGKYPKRRHRAPLPPEHLFGRKLSHQAKTRKGVARQTFRHSVDLGRGASKLSQIVARPHF